MDGGILKAIREGFWTTQLQGFKWSMGPKRAEDDTCPVILRTVLYIEGCMLIIIYDFQMSLQTLCREKPVYNDLNLKLNFILLKTSKFFFFMVLNDFSRNVVII